MAKTYEVLSGGTIHTVEADGWTVTVESNSLGFYFNDAPNNNKFVALFKNWDWVRKVNG